MDDVIYIHSGGEDYSTWGLMNLKKSNAITLVIKIMK